MRPLIGAVITVYFRSTAVRFGVGFGRRDRGFGRLHRRQRLFVFFTW